MRESFGGAFIIKLLLIFIIVYISFMAVAINYAKAFRIKNNVINILEQHKYNGNFSSIDGILEGYLKEVSYDISLNEIPQIKNNCGEPNLHYGVCITETSGGKNPKYYKVTTYIAIRFPLFNINLVVPISGETKSIYRHS